MGVARGARSVQRREDDPSRAWAGRSATTIDGVIGYAGPVA